METNFKDQIYNYKTYISKYLYPFLTWPPVMKSMLFIRKQIQILRAAFEKFIADSCSIRSSSIAYAIAISVIPILTILIRFAAVDRITIRANLASFLAANGMADSTELLEILDEILRRANQIAGLGVLFMLYSATNLVRNLEEAYNHIYRAKHQRPILYRFALYIASFAIIPTLLIFSAGVTRIALSKLQPAEPTAMLEFKDHQWVLHEPGMLWKFKKGSDTSQDVLEEIQLYERANTGANFREIFIDENNRKVGASWEIVGRDYSPPKLQQSDVYDTTIMRASQDTLYVITQKGLILFSGDNGHTWQFNRIHFKLTEVYSPEIHDAWVSDQNELILLVSINSRTGLIYGHQNSAWSYSRLPDVYNRIFAIDNIENPEARFQNGLYLSGKGQYLYSADGGRSWTSPRPLEYGDQRLYLHKMRARSNGDLYCMADSGELWIESAQGQSILNIRMPNGGTRIHGFDILESGHMLVYGANDFLRYSFNEGQNWLRAKNDVLNDNTFVAHTIQGSNEIYLATESQSLIHLSQVKLLDERDQQGFQMVEFQLRTKRSLPIWFTIFGKVMINLFIFIICYLMFFSAYKFIPNTPVSWQAAAGGSLFTSITILGFFVAFRFWITGFTTTGYIYGVWAAIPLGMLVILSSTQIILFGLEIAYIIQHPILYTKSSRKMQQRDSLLWSCLSLLAMIYHRLYGENSALTEEQAINYLEDSSGARLAYVRDTLLEAKLISFDELSGEFYPTKPASQILISDLQSQLIQHSLNMPNRFFKQDSKQETRLRNDFQKRAEKMQGQLKAKSDELNLADILPLMADISTIKKN